MRVGKVQTMVQYTSNLAKLQLHLQLRITYINVRKTVGSFETSFGSLPNRLPAKSNTVDISAIKRQVTYLSLWKWPQCHGNGAYVPP